jgi:preprotein translocase subunit YajC
MNTIHVGWLIGPGVMGQTESPPPGPARSSEGPATPGAGPGPESTGTQQPSGGAPTGQPGLFGSQFIWILLLMFVVMILVSSMGGRKEKRRRAEMLSGLARNDKVHTVGGLIGTIVDVHDQEVVLRTDEASNTRVRVARSAISQVIKPGGPRPGEDAKPAPTH